MTGSVVTTVNNTSIMPLSKCMCYDKNVTVKACNQSGFNVFNDNNGDLRDLFQIEDMIKVFNVLGMGAVFETNNI